MLPPHSAACSPRRLLESSSWWRRRWQKELPLQSAACPPSRITVDDLACVPLVLMFNLRTCSVL